MSEQTQLSDLFDHIDTLASLAPNTKVFQLLSVVLICFVCASQLGAPSLRAAVWARVGDHNHNWL